MRTLIHETAQRPRVAIALLAGTYAEPGDFAREGFLAALDARGIAARVVMAQVSAAYFADASVVERIEEEVVARARGTGREPLWLAGISLGALAALCYTARHEPRVARLALLSPYPGTRELLRAIDAAGGLDRWRAPQPPDLEQEAWRWLRARGRAGLALDCYYGRADRFVDGQRRLGAALPPDAVHEVDGGHDWPAWRAMWDDFLERRAP